jgi:hypothetical protein
MSPHVLSVFGNDPMVTFSLRMSISTTFLSLSIWTVLESGERASLCTRLLPEDIQCTRLVHEGSVNE